MASTQYASAAEFDKFAMPAKAFARMTTDQKNLALQFASRKAASYIKKRKVLPLVSWGDDLREAVCKLAAYEFMSNRGYKPLSGANSVIRERYNDAIEWLTLVSTGDVELVDCVDSTTTPGIDEAGPLAASDPIVNFSYQTRGGFGCPPRGDGLG